MLCRYETYIRISFLKNFLGIWLLLSLFLWTLNLIVDNFFFPENYNKNINLCTQIYEILFCEVKKIEFIRRRNKKYNKYTY